MGEYEAIDRLCSITTMLSDIVREQAAIIEQADIPESTKDVLKRKRDTANSELDAVWQEKRRG